MKSLAALVAAGALVLTGCAGSLLESGAEAPIRYRLAGESLADRGERLPLALGVARPRAVQSLETDRVAVVQPDSRFDYYAGVRWAEPATEMLQQQLVRAIAADGRFATVVASPSRVPIDLILDVELRRFEAVYAAGREAPEVAVEMQVAVIDVRQSRRVASFLASSSAAAAENRRAPLMAAFERAATDAVRIAVDQVRTAAAPVTATD